MGEPSPLVCCYPGQTKTFPPFSFVNSCGDGALTAHSTAGGNTAVHGGWGCWCESKGPQGPATSPPHLAAQRKSYWWDRPPKSGGSLGPRTLQRRAWPSPGLPPGPGCPWESGAPGDSSCPQLPQTQTPLPYPWCNAAGGGEGTLRPQSKAQGVAKSCTDSSTAPRLSPDSAGVTSAFRQDVHLGGYCYHKSEWPLHPTTFTHAACPGTELAASTPGGEQPRQRTAEGASASHRGGRAGPGTGRHARSGRSLTCSSFRHPPPSLGASPEVSARAPKSRNPRQGLGEPPAGRGGVRVAGAAATGPERGGDGDGQTR